MIRVANVKQQETIACTEILPELSNHTQKRGFGRKIQGKKERTPQTPGLTVFPSPYHRNYELRPSFRIHMSREIFVSMSSKELSIQGRIRPGLHF
jgi:hypothetical protein